MSDLNVTRIKGRTPGSSPDFPQGAVFTDTTQSTSATTGAVVISGGVGIAKSLHVGGNVSVGGTLTYEDVTNVDSVGLITARDGVKVTGGNVELAQGTGTGYYQITQESGNTVKFGIVSGSNIELSGTSNNDFYIKLNGNNERLRIGSGGQIGLSGANYGDSGQFLTSGGSGAAPTWTTVSAAPTASLVTSENLVAGDTISLKTNGQVEKTTSVVTQITPVDGSSIWVNGSQDGDETSVASDPLNPTKLFAAYRHQNNQIYSRIGTVTGIASYEDITWLQRGTQLSPVTTNGHEAISMCNIGSGKYLLVSGETTAYCRVINVNYAANTVTPESGYATLNGSNDMRNWDIESFGTDKAVICYRSNYDSKVYVVGVSVSGNTVTLGTPVEFDASTNLGDVNIRRVGNTSKFLATWLKDSTDGLLCRMGNLDTSTNTVTQVGNELTIQSGHNITRSSLTYTKDNKWICVFKAVSGYFRGAVISYDGTSTITIGTVLQISGNQTDHNSIVYDNDGDRSIAMFEDMDTGSGSLWATALSISGSTLSASALDEVSGENACYIKRRAAVYSSYWGATFGLLEMGSSNDLYKILVKSATVATNSDNFIGYVGGSFSAASTATIQVVGNINTNQSGLTPGSKYYVQKDGTLDIKESNPSVYAGRALSATSLLIKG